MNDNMRNVLRPRHIKLEDRPATTQEKLERIRHELSKFKTDSTLKTIAEQALYDELRKREKVLTEEIESVKKVYLDPPPYPCGGVPELEVE